MEHLVVYPGTRLIFEVRQTTNSLYQQSVHAWIRAQVLFCDGSGQLDEFEDERWCYISHQYLSLPIQKWPVWGKWVEKGSWKHKLALALCEPTYFRRTEWQCLSRYNYLILEGEGEGCVVEVVQKKIVADAGDKPSWRKKTLGLEELI